ncbi:MULTISPECIES: hypothetical protein [Virgibacillus]|uniref:Uncharacterized protein n=1 Tax=Virgibacillus chiguensis TaxID=411959 RepID=A0A1M5S154_9BACI|nr:MULTISPECIES: hypothetical protein [Virgibacillus]SHH32206.1 hypothetical protein SAMN05421807_10615 [Virgibacillus chiguensis]
MEKQLFTIHILHLILILLLLLYGLLHGLNFDFLFFFGIVILIYSMSMARLINKQSNEALGK